LGGGGEAPPPPPPSPPPPPPPPPPTPAVRSFYVRGGGRASPASASSAPSSAASQPHMPLAPGNVVDVVALLNSTPDPMMIHLDRSRFCLHPFGDWNQTTGLSKQEQTLCSRLIYRDDRGGGDLIQCTVKKRDGVEACVKTWGIPDTAEVMYLTETQALEAARAYNEKGDAAAAAGAAAWADAAARALATGATAQDAAAQPVQAQQLKRLLSLVSTDEVRSGDFVCKKVSGLEHLSGEMGNHYNVSYRTQRRLDGMISYMCQPSPRMGGDVVDNDASLQFGVDLPPGEVCTPVG